MKKQTKKAPGPPNCGKDGAFACKLDVWFAWKGLGALCCGLSADENDKAGVDDGVDCPNLNKSVDGKVVDEVELEPNLKMSDDGACDEDPKP